MNVSKKLKLKFTGMLENDLRYICIIAITFLSFMSSFDGKAQGVGDSYDGIILEPSEVNISSVYYGEPYSVFFRYGNVKSTENPYYVPGAFINTQFTLKNLLTGKSMPNINSMVNDATIATRRKFQLTKPTEPYKPNDIRYFELDVNEWFGIEKLAQETKYNALALKLQAIPPGEYELTFEYELFPSDKILKSSYKFKVLPLPPSEQKAFQKYVKSTAYACNAHYFGNKNYNANHPDSYESFIKQFSNSIFATHAFLNMVTQSYGYSGGGPTKEEQIEKFKEYLKSYSKLKNSSQKMIYVKHYSRFLSYAGKDVKKELNNFLYAVRNDHPAISEKLISDAAIFSNIKSGLTNYAKKTEQ